MGEGTVPNNPSTVTFCNTVLSLAGVGAELQTLVGNVDPTSHTTIINTQPSVQAMMDFVNNTTVILNAGDASVPPEVASAWATATAGLRLLLQTFKLAGYQLSNLPASAVEMIVEGANGFVIPGVPPDLDVLGATTAITAFFVSVCNSTPIPPPTPPAPARHRLQWCRSSPCSHGSPANSHNNELREAPASAGASLESLETPRGYP